MVAIPVSVANKNNTKQILLPMTLRPRGPQRWALVSTSVFKSSMQPKVLDGRRSWIRMGYGALVAV